MMQSRRQVLQTMAGLLSSGIIGESIAKPTKTFGNSIKDQKHMDNMSGPFLTLPGVSFSSLLYNINNLPNNATIYIDEQDWKRLRYQISDQPNYSKLQRLGMVYGELYRQGIITTIDYAKLYSLQEQNGNIKHNREIVSSASDEDLRHTVRTAAEGYIDYSLSSDQDTYRQALANLQRFRGHRDLVRDHAKKIDDGKGHPDIWTERLLNKYTAAFNISTTLSTKIGKSVTCIGQGESEAIAPLLGDDDDIFTSQFLELGEQNDGTTRYIFDQISELAKEVTGIDEKHWFLLGPRMVVPHHSDRFDQAWAHMRFDSTDKIIEETQSVLNRLRSGARESRSMDFLEAEVEWVLEENNVPHDEKERLLEQLESEIELSHKSKEITEIVESQDYTPAASFLAASIQADPLYRYHEDELYRRALSLKKKIDPERPHKLEKFKHRGGFRRGTPDEIGDWPQVINRSRTSA